MNLYISQVCMDETNPTEWGEHDDLSHGHAFSFYNSIVEALGNGCICIGTDNKLSVLSCERKVMVQVLPYTCIIDAGCEYEKVIMLVVLSRPH